MDLRELSAYRNTFASAYDSVIERIREDLGFVPSGRPSKSTTAIVEKLKRESVRLSQIQDIAGVRLVVPRIERQDQVVAQLVQKFARTAVVDRRSRPSHGYRAVHVIVYLEGVPVEIQVRTALQHLWAELSEKLSDLFDPSIKYGGGNHNTQSLLSRTSQVIATEEDQEQRVLLLQIQAQGATPTDPSIQAELGALQARTVDLSSSVAGALDTMLQDLRRDSEARP